MDRYVRREPWSLDYQQQQGNHVPPFGGGNNINPAENMYYRVPYNMGAPQNVQCIPNPEYSITQVHSPGFAANLPLGQNQVESGIDPRYLAAYANANANFIATGQQLQRERCTIPVNAPFGDDYQNHSVAPPPPERNLPKMSSPQAGQQIQRERCTIPANAPFGDDYQNHSVAPPERNLPKMFSPEVVQGTSRGMTPQAENQPKYRKYTQVQQSPSNVAPGSSKGVISQADNFTNIKQPIYRKCTQVQQSPSNVVKTTENTEVQKFEVQNQFATRFDKLKALYKSGTRVFSGPVEKVLKWHKALQDIGVMVLYEIVVKCVNVSPGEHCAKNLVVRDENGPAIQVVYYEVDFLLPELKPPCTIRVIGKMMAGSCRFQAFNVRLATGDDVATLSRRAAVAAHHVDKLCKEYGTDFKTKF